MNFGNLGVALGAGVQEWKAQQKADQEQQLFDQQKEQFGWQRNAEAEKERIRLAEQALSEKYRPMFAAAAKGDYSFVPEYLKSGYNTNTGTWNDGHTAAYQSGPNGSMVHVIDGNGQVVASHDLNPQSARTLLEQAYMMERAGIGAPQFGEYVKHGLESRKVGAEETKAGAARQQALTMEGYRNFQQNAPHFVQDGTGRILAMAPDGKSVLGTYGSARPVLGAGGSGSGGAETVVNLVDAQGNAAPFSFNKKTARFEPLGLPEGYRFPTQKVAPEVPQSVVSEFAKAYFQATPEEREMMRLQNPEIAAYAGFGSGLKVGAKGAKPPAPSASKEFAALKNLPPSTTGVGGLDLTDADLSAMDERRKQAALMETWKALNSRSR